MIKKKIFKLYRTVRYWNKSIFGSIGDNNTFTKNVYIGDDAVIGSNNYFGSRTMVIFAEIGSYCSIAPNVIIGPANHPVEFVTTSNIIIKRQPRFKYELFKEKTIIGNDVWIGANSVIKQGVVIGDGAVIGANSFVNKDVPAYSVVAGTPAKVIRKRFDDTVIVEIEQKQWWSNNPDRAAKDVAMIWEKICKQIEQ